MSPFDSCETDVQNLKHTKIKYTYFFNIDKTDCMQLKPGHI